MTEWSTPTRKKRKMGDTEDTAPKKPAAKWPLIKPKKNLQITRLRDFDLFTVKIPSSLSVQFLLFVWSNLIRDFD